MKKIADPAGALGKPLTQPIRWPVPVELALDCPVASFLPQVSLLVTLARQTVGMAISVSPHRILRQSTQPFEPRGLLARTALQLFDEALLVLGPELHAEPGAGDRCVIVLPIDQR